MNATPTVPSIRRPASPVIDWSTITPAKFAERNGDPRFGQRDAGRFNVWHAPIPETEHFHLVKPFEWLGCTLCVHRGAQACLDMCRDVPQTMFALTLDDGRPERGRDRLVLFVGNGQQIIGSFAAGLGIRQFLEHYNPGVRLGSLESEPRLLPAAVICADDHVPRPRTRSRR